jgi:hypothetical protein
MRHSGRVEVEFHLSATGVRGIAGAKADADQCKRRDSGGNGRWGANSASVADAMGSRNGSADAAPLSVRSAT